MVIACQVPDGPIFESRPEAVGRHCKTRQNCSRRIFQWWYRVLSEQPRCNGGDIAICEPNERPKSEAWLAVWVAWTGFTAREDCAWRHGQSRAGRTVGRSTGRVSGPSAEGACDKSEQGVSQTLQAVGPGRSRTSRCKVKSDFVGHAV